MIKKVAKEEGVRQVFYLGIKMIVNRTIGYFAYFSYFMQSRLLRKKFIHVIGDSHTGSFVKDGRFFVHHISHATAHNLCKKESSSNSNEKFWGIINKIDKKRDSVILVFGEIDSRIHIYYQYKKRGMKESMGHLIDKTIENYGVILGKLRELGVDFFVYGIPPAAKQENIYNREYYASEEERARINKKFDEKLKNYCKSKKYKYINIYSETCDEKGFIKKMYALDGVHLNKNIVDFVMGCLDVEFNKT